MRASRKARNVQTVGQTTDKANAKGCRDLLSTQRLDEHIFAVNGRHQVRNDVLVSDRAGCAGSHRARALLPSKIRDINALRLLAGAGHDFIVHLTFKTGIAPVVIELRRQHPRKRILFALFLSHFDNMRGGIQRCVTNDVEKLAPELIQRQATPDCIFTKGCLVVLTRKDHDVLRVLPCGFGGLAPNRFHIDLGHNALLFLVSCYWFGVRPPHPDKT